MLEVAVKRHKAMEVCYDKTQLKEVSYRQEEHKHLVNFDIHRENISSQTHLWDIAEVMFCMMMNLKYKNR